MFNASGPLVTGFPNADRGFLSSLSFLKPPVRDRAGLMRRAEARRAVHLSPEEEDVGIWCPGTTVDILCRLLIHLISSISLYPIGIGNPSSYAGVLHQESTLCFLEPGPFFGCPGRGQGRHLVMAIGCSSFRERPFDSCEPPRAIGLGPGWVLLRRFFGLRCVNVAMCQMLKENVENHRGNHGRKQMAT